MYEHGFETTIFQFALALSREGRDRKSKYR